MEAVCPNEQCRFFNTRDGCREDTHHLYWPRSEYVLGVEKRFRNLASNVVEMCMNLHQELHATTEPPPKPSVEEMRVAIKESKHV